MSSLTPIQTRPRVTLPANEGQIAEDRLALFERWRAVGPVVWTDGHHGQGGWLVLSHAGVRAVSRADDAFGKELFHAAERVPDLPEPVRRWLRVLPVDMFFRDDPDHRRLRGLITPFLDRQATQFLHHKVHELCDALLPMLIERGEFDVVNDFAWPVASLVLTELVGIDAADAWRFPAWALDRRHFTPLLSPPSMLDHITASVTETDRFLGRLVRQRRRQPADDLVSHIVAKQAGGYPVSDDEVIGTLRIMGFAGFETTRDLISAGVLALTESPESMAAVAATGGLPAGAVDELLRFVTPDQIMLRVAKRPVVVEGQLIEPGDQVFALLGAANRDPAVFTDPQRLWLDRPNAGDHVAFSAGTHFCAGFLVARLLTEQALSRLLIAMPALRVEPPGVRWGASFQARSARELPVRVEP